MRDKAGPATLKYIFRYQIRQTDLEKENKQQQYVIRW